MRNRTPQLLLWIVGCFVFSFAALSRAEGPPAAAETPTLEKAVDDLQKGADSLLEKAKELLGAIDSEAKAKRITEPVAQGLRWSLRNLTSLGAQDPRTALATVTMPAEDEAIMKAAQAYQETANKVRAEDVELGRRAERALGKRCVELVGNATAAGEVEPVQALIERLRTLTTGQQPYPLADTLQRCSNQMRDLRNSFDITPSSDPAVVSRVLIGLTPMHSPAVDFGSDASFDKRVAIVLAPFKKAFDDAQNDLDSALAERKPPERIYAALAALEEACSRLSGASNFRNSRNNSMAVLNAYRALCGIASAMDSHQWFRAKSQLASERQSLAQNEFVKSRKFGPTEILQKWEREISEGEADDARKFQEHLRQELGAVKQPSEVAAIIKELGKNRRDSEDGNNAQLTQMLSMRLTALEDAWKNDDPHRLVNDRFAEGAPDGAALKEDLAALRDRIGRDILSRTLKAPELLQAPLASQPLEKALDDFLGKLTAAGEWRRALQVMESQAALQQSPGALSQKMEVMTAVRSYLAGQNFELAELWTDAAAAYKAVLASAADGAPTNAAADRLKAIAKDHPEEVKAAQPSVRRDAAQIFRNGAQ